MSARVDYLIPARTRMGAGFLDRYLPHMAENVVAACAEALTLPGDLILDPFCQSPAVVLGAVSQGRRILACSHNPVDAFAVRQSLAPLPSRQINAAVTRLGETLRGTSALREHISKLYRCACPSCRRMAVADYFVWDTERDEPIEKYVRCAGCGFQGIALIQAEDLTVLEQIEERGLPYFFVLDRLAPTGDSARSDGERLLKLYTHRTRYALAHMVMKTEAEFANTPEADTLKYLLLACMVRCGLFNRPPEVEGEPSRRRGNLGMERNVWLAFEEAWKELREAAPPHPSLTLSALTESDHLASILGEMGTHNAAVVHSSLRDLARALPVQSVQLILTGLSAANQRYWRLCFLWSGWLFGRDKAAHLKPLLRQTTPDWPWYARTLGAAFRALRPKLRMPGYLAVLLSSRRSDQSEAAQLAAASAGLKPLAYVYGSESPNSAAHGAGEYRLLFAKGAEMMDGVIRPPDQTIIRKEIKDEATRGALEVLQSRGEPLSLGWLRNAAFARLSQRGTLQRVMQHQDETFSGYDVVQKQVEAALGTEGRAVLTPMEWEVNFAADATLPMLWLQESAGAAAPLGDRVEEAVIQTLRDALMLRREDCEDALYRQFPGLLTPERELVDECLASYSEESSPGYIRLRADDQPERVRAALGEVVADLEALGRRMGLEVARDRPPYHVVWRGGGSAYAFRFAPTAAIGPLAEMGPPEQETSRYLVVPESRLALLHLKLRRSPIYGRILQQGAWTFIRQPYIQLLLKTPQVDRHSLKQIVGLEPIIEKGEAQIPLF